jgi:hypothetical protein
MTSDLQPVTRELRPTWKMWDIEGAYFQAPMTYDDLDILYQHAPRNAEEAHAYGAYEAAGIPLEESLGIPLISRLELNLFGSLAPAPPLIPVHDPYADFPHQENP